MYNNEIETEAENKINDTTEIKEKIENEETNNILEISKEDIKRITINVEKAVETLEECNNSILGIQEEEQEIINAENTTTETQEAENKIIEMEESNNNISTPDNSNTEWTDISSMKWLDILADLSVPYDEPSVFWTNPKELETVDKFFDSLCCRRQRHTKSAL